MGKPALVLAEVVGQKTFISMGSSDQWVTYSGALSGSLFEGSQSGT